MCLVATEDVLSEAVVLKLLMDRMVDLQSVTTLREGGFGYLRRNVKKFSAAVRNGRSVFMLTDLDACPCAPSMKAEWFASAALPEKFLFRIAVREIETWIMSDTEALASFLGISPAKIRQDVENIIDPKRYLLKLAQKGHRDIQKDLLPKKGALALQGFGYNQRLTDFVRNHWSPMRAGENSPSLMRTLLRLETWISGFQSKTKVL